MKRLKRIFAVAAALTLAGGSAAEFVVGEYKVTGYGTENATIEKIEAPEA